MLQPLLLGTALAVGLSASVRPAYLPLPDEVVQTAAAVPAAPAPQDMPSFPLPVGQGSAARTTPREASATFWMEVLDEDMPAFPIPVPRPGGPGSADPAGR